MRDSGLWREVSAFPGVKDGGQSYKLQYVTVKMGKHQIQFYLLFTQDSLP